MCGLGRAGTQCGALTSLLTAHLLHANACKRTLPFSSAAFSWFFCRRRVASPLPILLTFGGCWENRQAANGAHACPGGRRHSGGSSGGRWQPHIHVFMVQHSCNRCSDLSDQSSSMCNKGAAAGRWA